MRNPYKLAESLKNYTPSHHILLDAARLVVFQAEQLQSLARNRHHWKQKAEKQKPLTDEEILDIHDELLDEHGYPYDVLNLARAIEERHGIK